MGILNGYFFNLIRGLAEENTLIGIISPIGYFKSPIGDILYNLGLEFGSLTLLYLTQKCPIPNMVYYPQVEIC